MGCSISKDVQPETESSAVVIMQQEAKSRLEWKMCHAKETPEPDFDLSECMLTRIPSGVFVLCKVLRKETLNLSHNQLENLQSGGTIDDLVLLKSLNINFNYITKLPEDLYKIENLRELCVSNNQIKVLPSSINRLRQLELFNVSNNNLQHIQSINCMPNLRILNISGNIGLNTLPFELSTCDSLTALIFDAEHIQFPPKDIIEKGTIEILNYLTTANGSEIGQDALADEDQSKKKYKPTNINTEFITREQRQQSGPTRKQQNSDFIEQEMRANELLQLSLMKEQQKRKEEFLQRMIAQQNEGDSMAQKLQEENDIKRAQLIANIHEEEKIASKLVSQWLALKQGPDPVLLEKERQEQERLLSDLHLKKIDLRRQEIMNEMVHILQLEENFVADYNKKRDNASRQIVEMESNTNVQLHEIFKNRGLENSNAVVNMLENEKLQKIAVEALIARNDSRTWGLVEQVRIVETQLAHLSQYEISRKRLNADKSLVDLCEERSKLTMVLLDLLHQQTARKEELLNSIKCVEMQKEDQQQDFWLLQYQKLIDAIPDKVVYNSVNIDPQLGHQLLINGMIHYIPLLAFVFQKCNGNFSEITDDDLVIAGIKNARDRVDILQSIQNYYYEQVKLSTAYVPVPEKPSSTSASEPPKTDEEIVNANECVICMERSCQTIFIPCGHLCCCAVCQEEIVQCPMCRADIDRRIKVIPA